VKYVQYEGIPEPKDIELMKILKYLDEE